MVKTDVLFLISESPKERGVFDSVEREKRMVYCSVRSVGMSEIYEAMGHNLTPEYVFDLADRAEYQDEKLVEYNGKLYDVIRTYVNRQKIEITVARREWDAR